MNGIRLIARARVGLPLALTILVARYLVQMWRAK